MLKGSGEFVIPLGKQLFMLTLKEEDLKIYLVGCIIDHVDIFCNSEKLHAVQLLQGIDNRPF